MSLTLFLSYAIYVSPASKGGPAHDGEPRWRWVTSLRVVANVAIAPGRLNDPGGVLRLRSL